MSDSPPEVPKTGRRSGWKVVGLIAAGLGVIVLTYALYINAVARRRWADMEASVRDLRTECDARNAPRPALRGTAVPGSAWEDYTPALNSLKGLRSGDLGDFVIRAPKADRVKVEALLASNGSALDGLRKGAARADGIYPVKWEDGFSSDIPGLLQSQNLINMAVCRARFLVEEGKPREAAELLLDGGQYARDLGYNQFLISEMISNALYGIVFDELRDLIYSGKLPAADLAQVGRELEILDSAFPQNSHSLMNEAMVAGYGFMKLEGGVGEAVSSLGGAEGSEELAKYLVWRTVFPQRLTCADAYFTQLDFMKRYSAAADGSWKQIAAAGPKDQAEIAKIKNPIAKIMVPGFFSTNRVGRERLAQLRLLRVAAHHAATGEILSLDDPFGAKLMTSPVGGKLKVWSAGRDGVDDGGLGEWKPQAGKDIVLEPGK